MAIHESGENYLEAILMLKESTGFVRSIDVASYLGVTKPSVSRAMSILRNDGYLEMEQDGELILTDKGLSVAQNMYERHELLTEYLVSLGVSRDIAADDACRIEHVISQESFLKLRKHAKQYHDIIIRDKHIQEEVSELNADE